MEKFDHAKHAERIRVRRGAAMSEIWTERGIEGVIALLADCGAPIVVGEMLDRASGMEASGSNL